MLGSLKDLLGFDDLMVDLKKMTNDTTLTLRRGVGATHTLTVQKPYCAPARNMVLGLCEEYGVKIFSLSEDRTVNVSIRNWAQIARIELKHMENLRYGPGALLWLPMAIQCQVEVSKAQAGWAEYLIERTMKMCVVGGRINAKNRDWATAHDGQLPRPWVEKNCTEGQAIWQTFNNAQAANNGAKPSSKRKGVKNAKQ